jgi:hypothetical protein
MKRKIGGGSRLENDRVYKDEAVEEPANNEVWEQRETKYKNDDGAAVINMRKDEVYNDGKATEAKAGKPGRDISVKSERTRTAH